MSAATHGASVSGVPQRSMFDPLLFTAYVSPVGDVIESRGVSWRRRAAVVNDNDRRRRTAASTGSPAARLLCTSTSTNRRPLSFALHLGCPYRSAPSRRKQAARCTEAEIDSRTRFACHARRPGTRSLPVYLWDPTRSADSLRRDLQTFSFL